MIEIQKWDTLAKFYAHLSPSTQKIMKLWLRQHKDLIPVVQEWKYPLSWCYGKGDLLSLIAQWPEKSFTRLTLLEGWSKYDIDAKLTHEGLIQAWEFIAKTEDQQFIQSLKSEFSFLLLLPVGKSLEGFLYPDTYFLDQNWDLSEKLIKAQLKNFNQKIWLPFAEKFQNFGHQLSPYQLLILASVIENEEKHAENKPIIAGIFLNRLEKGMRLDADVTLCYGLKITYDQCRQNILPNLKDAKNPYNTRANYGLMPTPISSPSKGTISALLNFKKTDYLFYLHNEKSGQVYYAETVAEHNANKVYL